MVPTLRDLSRPEPDLVVVGLVVMTLYKTSTGVLRICPATHLCMYLTLLQTSSSTLYPSMHESDIYNIEIIEVHRNI